MPTVDATNHTGKGRTASLTREISHGPQSGKTCRENCVDTEHSTILTLDDEYLFVFCREHRHDQTSITTKQTFLQIEFARRRQPPISSRKGPAIPNSWRAFACRPLPSFHRKYLPTITYNSPQLPSQNLPRKMFSPKHPTPNFLYRKPTLLSGVMALPVGPGISLE